MAVDAYRLPQGIAPRKKFVSHIGADEGDVATGVVFALQEISAGGRFDSLNVGHVCGRGADVDARQSVRTELYFSQRVGGSTDISNRAAPRAQSLSIFEPNVLVTATGRIQRFDAGKIFDRVLAHRESIGADIGNLLVNVVIEAFHQRDDYDHRGNAEDHAEQREK